MGPCPGGVIFDVGPNLAQVLATLVAIIASFYAVWRAHQPPS